MKKSDIIEQLEEILDFMLDNAYEIPKITPQHIIQHFENLGLEIDLMHSKSLLLTLETHDYVIQDAGFFSLTESGRIISQLGGFDPKFDLSDEEG